MYHQRSLCLDIRACRNPRWYYLRNHYRIYGHAAFYRDGNYADASCTDIIVVMSEQTKLSWWVPFEVGMSAQIDMPTATFLHGDISLPSYLSYWPRLKNLNDVTTYIKVRKKVEASSQRLQEHYSAAERRKIQTELFYDALKRELR